MGGIALRIKAKGKIAQETKEKVGHPITQRFLTGKGREQQEEASHELGHRKRGKWGGKMVKYNRT